MKNKPTFLLIAAFAVLMLLLLAWPLPAQSPLPQWVQNLPVWHWHAIPNTALASVDPSPRPFGSTGPRSKIIAWNGATLKRAGSCYMLGAAGGHADYAGNEVDQLCLNVATPRWEQIAPPSANEFIINSPALFFLDLKPSPTHTYYSTQFLDSRNKMIVISMGGVSGPFPAAPPDWPWTDKVAHPYVFDYTARQWEHPSTIPPFTGGGDATAGLVVKHPVTDDVYVARTGFPAWWKLSAATLTWTQVSQETDTNYAGAAIDPTRDHVLAVGCYNAMCPPRLKMLNGQGIQTTFGGLGPSALLVGGYPGVVYDEANDTFLVLHNNNPIEVIRVHAGTAFVDKPVITGTPPADRANGIQNSVQYVPELGGIVIANTHEGNVYFMRTSAMGAPTPEPPDPPQDLPVGQLVHDGPATPEQLSLLLPVTGTLPQTATATLRYRPTGQSAWAVTHPLYRIQPSFSGGSLADGFAWPLTGLAPGVSYDIEATVTSGTVSTVRTLTHRTRALPAACGPANKTVTVGQNVQAAFDALVPGDVLELADGTHAVNGLQLRRSGSQSQPACITGTKKAILRDVDGPVIQVLEASDLILDSFTLQGSGIESGTAAISTGISFWDGAPTQTRLTFRNLSILGVDRGIVSHSALTSFLAYNNVLSGNNTWTQALLETNATWNDDGINAPGFGNAIFNNTLTGFGDTLAFGGVASGVQSAGVHFYRNEIRNGGDDTAEVDGAARNITLYDNRVHNAMTLVSLDPLLGGPFVATRNIAINIGRSPYKFNSGQSGQFIYNNTVVRTTGPGAHATWGWVQFSNGPQRAWGYQNNVQIYRGTGNPFAFEAAGNDPIDFTHNSWFPDGSFWWTGSGGSSNSLAGIYAALPATTPVFSGLSKRHEADRIEIANPFTSPIILGATYLTEVTATYLPALAPGMSKNTGIALAGITDGFSGQLPDRGAVIEGRAAVVYGADAVTLPPEPTPAPALTLTASPSVILKGETSTLNWSALNAASVTVAGVTVGASGNQQVKPEVTTTYTATATGAGGTATRSAVVTVTQPVPPQPGDIIAPEVTFTSPQNGGTFSGNVPTFKIRATDNICVTRIELYEAGYPGFIAASHPQVTCLPDQNDLQWRTRGLTKGKAYTFTVKAFDPSGNMSEATITATRK